ncbi:hypothetical protein E2C01_081264 [Portunus trituberculatus]|uniref:Uncharacterized protein n=1 Tax=Portunus trituberculatus TaxID=210409 RepID=A0A5B7IXH3_PORTR|nr:hypothetical protein [Portunus trituberculatus]
MLDERRSLLTGATNVRKFAVVEQCRKGEASHLLVSHCRPNTEDKAMFPLMLQAILPRHPKPAWRGIWLNSI